MDRQAEVLLLPMAYRTLAGLAYVLGAAALFAWVIGWRSASGEALVLIRLLTGLCALGAVLAGSRAYLIATQSPTGLRLDPQGLSGYILNAPVAWDEIKAIGMVRTARSNTARVALALHDPKSFAGRVRKGLRPTESSETWQYHVLIGGGVALSQRDMLGLLQDWHARYGDRDDAA